MSSIRAVGFDMDYTLAQYKPETFEHLAYSQTVEKLVTKFGYPAEMADLDFDWQYMMRGLTIDKERGNVIKIDRHKYVKIAYHGLSPLDKEERKRTYSSGTVRDSFDGDDYTTIDTLFSLAEAYLFMQVVDMKDTHTHVVLTKKSYKDIYRDIRGAVDLCHRDGSLKAAVAANPEKYIHQDSRLKDLLLMYRLAGRKVFLATNSLWDYTNVVMNFLLGGRVGADKNEDWLEMFDVVMTGCQKPGFFTSKNILFQVNSRDSTLVNTDNGAPMLPIDQHDIPSYLPATSEPLAHSKVFQGGSVSDLHKMLEVRNAHEVLYVGDHIYGDILRSKKAMGWRTMLVVPELEIELRHSEGISQTMAELAKLRELRDHYDERIQRYKWDMHVMKCGDEEDFSELQQEIAKLEEERDRVAAKHTEVLAAHHDFFHPVWGQLLKTGYQNSKYAHLIERFACLYGSHVSNLAFYSPDKKFRGRVDVMAHEHALPDSPMDADVLKHVKSSKS